MSLSDCFPNDNNLSQHKDEEPLGSQGNSLQDDSGHSLTLDGIYGGDNMSEGDLEDDLEYLYILYQAPTAPQKTERINSDPGSRPPTPIDPLKHIRDPRHSEVTEDALGALVGPPPQRDPNLIQLREAGVALARRVIHPNSYFG